MPQAIENGAVESPCIRHCSLDDKDVCVGCFRHIDEIVGWNNFSNELKQDILTRCQRRQENKDLANQ